MAEDTQLAQKEPVTEQQDSPMPDEEQKTAEESNIETASQDVSSELPEDAKERTKRVVEDALQKAKTFEEQLKEERVRREYYESLFQSTRTQQEEQQPSVIDPETGFLNEQVLTNVQKQAFEAERRATKAEQAISEFQTKQENEAVFAVHPEVNPGGKEFNQDLHNLTASLALHSMVNPDKYGGKALSFMEATEKAKKILTGSEEAKAQVVKETLDQLTPKEQASFEAGSPGRRGGESDLEELRKTSRGKDARARQARIERFERITQE